jgi:CheY-like chemotaxis protein
MLDGINILVVEDNELNQRITNFILLKQHACIKNATNGKQAIEMLRQGDFDIVLMDLQMPEMDGIATTRYIRQELKKDVPIIGITADVFINDTPHCLEAGMNMCITKPFEAKTITSLILDVIGATSN